MATELAGAHDDKRITYYCDTTMKDDLRKPHKITDGRGRVSIAAESTQTGHADHFWGLALGWRAAFGVGATWTFAPVAVAPDSGAGAALGMRDGFTSRRLD